MWNYKSMRHRSRHRSAPFHSSSSLIPLSMVNTGETVTVRQIRGGKKVRSRLIDLGLNRGSTLRVIKNDVNGPLILAVKEDSRFALGRGMAHHILTSSCPDPT